MHMNEREFISRLFGIENLFSCEEAPFGVKSEPRKFPTREKALFYLKQVAQLKAGDDVWFKANEREPEHAIFLYHGDDGINVLAYSQTKQRAFLLAVPFDCIWFIQEL